jgi:RNA polymerase sigma-70 factor (ECF subfamily)
MPIVATQQPTDPQLVAAWRSGDEAAAAALVRRHSISLARFLSSKGVAGDDLEDLVQETFIKAFRGLHTWRGESSLINWLFSIARNLLRDQHRKIGGRITVELVDRDIVDSADPEAEFAAREMGEQLMRGIEKLSPMQRQVFTLRIEQGLSYTRIAVQLGTSSGAARVHYHNAMKKLKESVK